MNCHEFENKIVDSAQGIFLSAELQDHAHECSRCTLHLRNKEAWENAMGQVANADKSVAPPPQLEAALLTAFRQQHQKISVPATGWMDSVSAFLSRMKWGLATAAVLLLLGFAVVKMLPNDSQKIADRKPELKPDIVAPVPALKIPQAPEPEREYVKRSPMNTIRTIPVASKKRYVAPSAPTSSTSVEVGDFEIYEPEKPLLAKDFIPFDYAATMPLPDSLQVMRVKLAREKLASMGLMMPRNNRQSQFVNADLLVGSDGVPRAINMASLR